MDMNDRTNRILAGIAVILLVIGAWYLGRMQTKSSTETGTSAMNSDSKSNDDVSATTPSITASNESVVVADQPAGSRVNVMSVTLPQGGWVAVRDNNGRVLGAGRYDAGTSEDVVVELLRDTVSGLQYQVLLYIDDGDGQYDLHKDSLVMNADASVAGTVFNAQ